MKFVTRLAGVAAILCFVESVSAQNAYPYLDTSLTIEQRVNNIVSLMTLEEKIAAITGSGIPHSGIPAVGGAEAIHQVRPLAGELPTTSFSQVYGMGETWDPELIRRAGAVEGYEARYISQNEKYKRNALALWAPTSDLARDPRWGRTDESFGEDPFLTGTMVVAMIKGIQGDDPKYWQAASLLKHFFANSNETTRGHSSSDFDERLMREYYSVPFRMGFLEGGAKSFMTSYNAWNGVPMTVHPMLRSILEKQWGAGWTISSDLNATELVVDGHKYLPRKEESAAAAIKAGVNQFLSLNQEIAETVKQALKDGLLTESDLDEALRRRLKTTIRLGLLDPPAMVSYTKIGAAGEPEPWTTEKHKAVARKVARESVVLLKNASGILPLKREGLKRIAIVGPRASAVLTDFYGTKTSYAISVLDGVKNKVSAGTTVNFASDNVDNAAVKAAKSSDVVVVVVGNDPMCGAKTPWEAFNPDASTKPCPVPGEGREGRDRESIDLPDEELIKQVYAVNPKTVVVLISSFPYAINWSKEHVPAILHITHAAQEQGTAIADVLFGDYNPAGRLVQTWPKSLEQLPPIMDYDIRHGRTYMYFKGEPLFPFGYGLSYSTFEYSNLQLSSPRLDKTGHVTVGVQVENTGKRAGEEVIQFYVRHTRSSVSRPSKELKGFRRVKLQPGEKKTVTFSLAAESLAWWNEKSGGWEVEAEPVELLIGSSSADIRLSQTLPVE
jgi:beta-glucosidase